MPEAIRGSIRYIQRYKQLISFEGLERHRKITPTDIDGLIDYNGNAFIYMEFKTEGKLIDFGQKKAIENVVDSHEIAGHRSCGVLIYHNVPSDRIIDAKSQIVNSIYQNHKWTDWSQSKRTVNEFIEIWENWCLSKNVKI